MNEVSYFEIQASNPSKLVEFYTGVLGWKCERDESIPIEYYRIFGAGPFGAILKRPAAVPPMEAGTNAFTCSIQVENFDETTKKIIELGGIEAMPKFAIAGKCWQGYFVDPDHNVFGIFQPDPHAK